MSPQTSQTQHLSVASGAGSAPARTALSGPWWITAARLALWAAIGVYFAFATAVIGLRYWVLPNIDRYNPAIERAASAALGGTVTVGRIEAGWQGLRPQLALSDVKIHDDQGRVALALPSVEAIVSWTSVALGSIQFETLAFDSPALAVRRDASGRLFIGGFELKHDQDGDKSAWLLSQPEIVIRGAALSWDDALRGAPTLALTGVNLTLQNSGNRHRFALHAGAAPELASVLDIRGEFFGRSLAQLREWNGRLYAELEYTDLAAWQRWVDYPLEIRSGQGAVRLWLGLVQGAVSEVTADVALANVAARMQAALPLLELEYLQGRLGGRKNNQRMEAFGHQITLKAHGATGRDSVTLLPGDFRLEWEPGTNGKPDRGEIQANAIDLEPLSRLLAFMPVPQELRSQLAASEPRGNVFDMRLAWTGDFAHPERYSARGRIDNAGARPYRRGPGFDGLSGRFDATERGGTLALESDRVTLELPRLLPEEKTHFDTLTGQIGWNNLLHGVELRFSNLSAANKDLAGTLSGSYSTRSADAGPGAIDLTGTLTRADARAAYRYIPRLPPAVAAYLKSAIVAGSSTHVRLRFKGDLRHFPFADAKQGTFQVHARVAGGNVNYAAAWPGLSDINGDLVIDGRSLRVTATRATVLGVRASGARVTIADLFGGNELVQVEGQAEGSTGEFLGFVRASPLAPMLDGGVENIGVSGNGRLQLKFDLPLRRPEQVRVAGNYQMIANRFDLAAAFPPLSQVSGRLDFSETGLTARGVTAQFLGGAITLGLNAGKEGVSVTAGGTSSVAAVRQAFDVPMLQHASGAAAWHASISARQRALEVTLESPLAGVAINLPPPLGKTAAESVPLRVTRGSEQADVRGNVPANRDYISFSLGSAANGRLVRRSEGGHYVLERGGIGIGAPAVLPGAGLAINGKLDYVNFDQWQEALVEGSSPNPSSGQAGSLPSAAPGSAQPRSGGTGMLTVNLKVGALDFGTRRLNDLALRLGTSGGDWSGTVEARELGGAVTWRPEGRGRVEARLRHFTLPEQAPGTAPRAASASSRELPALDLIAENFIARDRKLGRLELVAINEARDWRINKLVLSNPESTLSADGIWQNWAARPSISVNIALDVNDVGAYLDRLGYAGAVRRGTAKMAGKVGWVGGPQAIDYPTLTGEVSLSAGKGQFLKADPGVAKLLSIFSLQSLLSFDLRDVFAEGFAFDTLASTFRIEKGRMSTGDFRMRGPAAQVAMSGDINLADETQNLRLRVVPSLGDSAAAFAALLLNPVAGLGALIAQRLLKDPLGQIFAFEYAVTGGWSEPKVERVRIEQTESVAR